MSENSIMNIDQIPGNIKPDALITLCREKPFLIEQYRMQDPEYADAIASGDILRVRSVMMKRIMRNSQVTNPTLSSIQSSSVVPSNNNTSTSTYSATDSNTSQIYPHIGLIEEIGSNVRPEQLIEICIQQPHLLQQFRSRDPELGDILHNKDITKLRTIMLQRGLKSSKRQYEENLEMEMLARNPDSEEYQKKLAEKIRQENVLESRNFAMENFPESFGQITMLYVDTEINSQPIKAFVDSGAQMTVMSMKCAERCNLLRLLDTAFSGEAQGVGTAKIAGRIHMTQMKFGNTFFPISITVLESDGLEFLLGLDMLRRYRGCIDMYNNCLRFSIGDTFEEAQFLSEADIPSNSIFKKNQQQQSSPVQSEGQNNQKGEGKEEEVSSEKLAELMSLGYSEEQAKDALARAGGNLEVAAALLLNN